LKQTGDIGLIMQQQQDLVLIFPLFRH